MEKKFTEGNWVSKTLDNYDILIMCGPKILAEVYSMDVGDDEDIANGELMAAAPELLDACIKIAEYIELHNISDGEAYYIVKNAIKKATE